MEFPKKKEDGFFNAVIKVCLLFTFMIQSMIVTNISKFTRTIDHGFLTNQKVRNNKIN